MLEQSARQQLTCQCPVVRSAIAIAVTMAFAAVATGAVLGLLHVTVGLRVPLDAEVGGLDISEHGEEACSGTDVGTLAGRRAALGESVLIPAGQMKPTPAV
jgi:hypothetical protein